MIWIKNRASCEKFLAVELLHTFYELLFFMIFSYTFAGLNLDSKKRLLVLKVFLLVNMDLVASWAPW